MPAQAKAQVREGVLSSSTFPALLYSILGRRDTGVLTLTSDTAEKTIYVQDGRPTFATSSDRDDRLGQVLFRNGHVSLEGMLKAVEVSVASGKRLGTVLVEQGVIQPHDLVEGVRAQVRHIISSLFGWTRGRYRYAPGALPTNEVITLKLSPGEMIVEGIRSIESWGRIWEAVGPIEATYRTTERLEEVRDLPLSLEEWNVLSHCERPTRLLEICRTSPLPDFELCRFLWAALTLGVVQRQSGRSQRG